MLRLLNRILCFVWEIDRDPPPPPQVLLER